MAIGGRGLRLRGGLILILSILALRLRLLLLLLRILSRLAGGVLVLILILLRVSWRGIRLLGRILILVLLALALILVLARIGLRVVLGILRILALVLILLLLLILVLIVLVALAALVLGGLLLQFVELALHEVAVELRVGVVRFQLQRVLVGLDRLLPGLDGLLAVALLGLLAQAVEGVAEVVIGLLLDVELVGLEGLLVGLARLVVLVVLVGRRAEIELQLRRRGLRLLRRLLEFLLGLGVIAFLERLLARLRGGPQGADGGEGETEQQRGGGRGGQASLAAARQPSLARGFGDNGCAGPAPGAAGADQGLEEQRQQAERQRPLESFQRHPHFAGRLLVVGERGQLFLIQLGHALAPLPQRAVGAAGRLGDLAEAGFVEPRLDDLAPRVVDEVGPARVVRNRDQIALRRADADGIDLEAVLGRLLGGVDRRALEVFAVGHEDEELGAARLGPEGFLGLADRAGDIGPAARDRGGVERVDRLPEGVPVERQRAFEEGFSGEGDQPQPVPVEPVGQIVDRHPGPGQPVGLHVLGQHALRGVDREEDIDAPLLRLLPEITGLGPGQRDEEAGQAEEEEESFDRAARGRNRGGQLFQKMARGEGRQGRPLPPVMPVEEPGEQSAGRQPDRQPIGIGEFHNT